MKIFINRGVIKVILFVFVLQLVSCHQNKTEKKGALKESTAYFDYFNYQGKDDFYEQNPLPTPDAYYNPILPGWYSEPSICSNGTDFFLVNSTFAYFPGVPIFYSRDLINWKQIGHVLNRPSQLTNLEGQHITGGIFAPAISYNQHNKTYYMITTNVGAGNFFVKTTDPFSSWSDPIWLPEVHGIDLSFFFDDDGRSYILNSDEPDGGSTYFGHRAIRIREFDLEHEKVIGSEKVLISGGVNLAENPVWIQGPQMYKINNEYYLMAAEGGFGKNHSEVVLRGKKPMGEFVGYKNNPILTQRQLSDGRANQVTCAGRADMVQDKNGDWWSVFLACRPNNGEFENLGRETFLMPVRWTNDGYPYITNNEELVPLIGRKQGALRNASVTFGNFCSNDNFNKPTLGMEWMTLRSPALNQWSLTENEGWMAIKTTNVSATEKKVPSFVCRRIQHHKFECHTKLKIESESASDKAGILLYKDESHQYFFGVNTQNNEMSLSLQKISNDGILILAESIIENKSHEVKLKVDSQGNYFDFYYAIGDNKWELIANNIDAQYLSSANSFGFTSATIGMYAYRP